jgi:hypothetical protein
MYAFEQFFLSFISPPYGQHEIELLHGSNNILKLLLKLKKNSYKIPLICMVIVTRHIAKSIRLRRSGNRYIPITIA